MDLHFQARAARRDSDRARDVQDTVLVWNPGDRIPIGPGRTLQVVRVRDEDADQPPVLVVQDLGLKERLAPSSRPGLPSFGSETFRVDYSVVTGAAVTRGQNPPSVNPCAGWVGGAFDGVPLSALP